MKEQTRGDSFVAYTYEAGDALRFAVTFPYLQKSHVNVYVGDPDSPRWVMTSWADDNTVTIPSQDGILAPPYSVLVRRITPFKSPAVNFKDGANLPARDLNTANLQLLYVLQESRDFGGPGGGPGGGNGPMDDIQTIIDNVVQSPAFQAVTTKIPEIDANAEVILQDLLRSDEFFDSQREQAYRITRAETRIETISTGNSEIAQQITELVAAKVDLLAKYQEVNQAVVDEAGARATAIQNLAARVDTQDAATLAAAQTAINVVATAEGANTSWRQTFASQWGNPADPAETTTAAIKSTIDTKATPEEAASIASTAVTSFANGTFAALKQNFETYVSTNDGKWSATWSIQVNGGNPAKPIIAGLALSATPQGTDFVVQADRFAFTTPGIGYDARKFPFVIGQVGGLSTVGIQGQLLVDGTVTANKIMVNELSAITANAGTFNGGTFRTYTLNASGQIINPNEFRVEISNVGSWPIWVGSGTKVQNNAVFWVDRSGNAGFTGKIQAANAIGDLQSSAVVWWNGNTAIGYGAGWADIHWFSLPAPKLPGEYHSPFVMLMVSCWDDGAGSGVANLQLQIQELRGGTWVAIGDSGTPAVRGIYGVPLPDGGEVFKNVTQDTLVQNLQVLGIGERTNEARTFRILARASQFAYIGGWTPNPRIKAVFGQVAGLR